MQIGCHMRVIQDYEQVLREKHFRTLLEQDRRILIDEAVGVTLPAGTEVKCLGVTGKGLWLLQLERASIGPKTAQLYLSSVSKPRQQEIHKKYRGYLFLVSPNDVGQYLQEEA